MMRNVVIWKHCRTPLTERRQELRYRRQFFAADTTPLITLIAVVVAVMALTIRNDLILLRGTTMLSAVLVLKAVYALSAIASIILLRRTRSVRRHARFTLFALVSVSVLLSGTALSRLITPEFQGPVISGFVFLSLMYFALRGPVLARTLAACSVSAATVAVLLNPLADVSRIMRLSGPLAFIALNIIGVVSARSFEEQRRKRFRAEQLEKIAKQKLAAQMLELSAAKERAEAMSRARTAFLAAMSHEFRTPMNAVIGLSDLLVDAPLDPEHKEQIATIRDSSRALLRLLNDILDFAKIDAGQLTLSPAPFDLRGLCKSVIEMLRPQTKSDILTLSLKMSPDIPKGVLGDETRLRQVLINLLSNALKFTERGQVNLHVGAQPQGDADTTLHFRIEDTGIGMTPEIVTRMFLPFEQADQGTTRRYGGTGLGLAISKQIVNAMGSDIRVETEPGRGSSFSFSIRLPSAIPPRESVPTAQNGNTNQPPLKILVVDDHPINRRVAQAIFLRLGYPSDLAADGFIAVEALKNNNYDIIFMDLQMPGISGLETTRLILNNNPEPPHIVAMTASVFDEDRIACREAGMTDFISKPIEMREVATILTRIAEARGINPPADNTIAPLNREALNKLKELETLAEPGFLKSLCEDFIKDTEERLTRMNLAWQNNTHKDFEREAHSLKSASASLGATNLSSLCAKLESAAREQNLKKATHLWKDLPEEFNRTKQALLKEIEE